MSEEEQPRWFMAYAHVYQRDGRMQFGHNVYSEAEHPVARAARWTKAYGRKEGFSIIVLSFQQVGPDCPDADELGAALGV